MSWSHRYGIAKHFTNWKSRNKVFHRSLGIRMVARIDRADNHSSSKLRCGTFFENTHHAKLSRTALATMCQLSLTLSVASTHFRLAEREAPSHNSCRLPRCGARAIHRIAFCQSLSQVFPLTVTRRIHCDRSPARCICSVDHPSIDQQRSRYVGRNLDNRHKFVLYC